MRWLTIVVALALGGMTACAHMRGCCHHKCSCEAGADHDKGESCEGKHSEGGKK